MRELIRCKFFRLLVPYYGFEIINLILSVFLSMIFDSVYIEDFCQCLISIFTCINMESYSGICLRLWFLPCMFFCDILFYIVRKQFKNNLNILGIFFAGILISISYLINYFYNKRLPFTLDIVWMATAFMVIGYCYGSVIENTMKGLNKNLFVISISVFLVSVLFNEPVYMYMADYGNYLWAVLGSISGSVIFVIILKVIYNYIEEKKYV